MVEKRQKELTNSEKIESLCKSLKFIIGEVKEIKQKKEEIQIGKDVKQMMNSLGNQGNEEFMLDGTLHSLPQVTPDEKQQFFKELRMLMIKYKVINVVANLIKKF